MRRVPSRVNLEAMRREARDSFHALRQRDAAALRRYHSIDPLAGLSQPSFSDARYIIAREYGYSSWQKLQTHLLLRSNSSKPETSAYPSQQPRIDRDYPQNP